MIIICKYYEAEDMLSSQEEKGVQCVKRRNLHFTYTDHLTVGLLFGLCMPNVLQYLNYFFLKLQYSVPQMSRAAPVL